MKKNIFNMIADLLAFIAVGVFGESWGDDWEGSGVTSPDETQLLLKALQANEGTTDIATLTGGSALQVQSLEKTLANLTFAEEDMAFWQNIPKEKAFSTLEEYSFQEAYGSEGSFVGQLENAEEDDPEYSRAFAVMKYLRQIWRVGDVLKSTQTISDAEMLSVQGAIMRLLRDANKNLYFGDSSIVSQQFDGIIKTITDNTTTDHIIDMAGADITEAKLRDGAQLIQDNFGKVTKCYVSLGGQTSIDNILLNASAQRYIQGQTPSELGAPISGMRTSFGNFIFKSDRFLNIEGQGVPVVRSGSSLIEGATSKKAPATPSFTLTANTTVTGSLFASTGRGGAINGAYNYRVVAINNFGKSAAAAQQSATVAVGGSVSITITAGSNGNPTYGYEIYRETTPGSGVMRYMTKIKIGTGATTVATDLNADLPGTGVMIMVDDSSTGAQRSMVLSQLLPLHRTRYAKIGPYEWGAVNYYVVPKWYAPKRYVLIKNVKISGKNRPGILDI